MNRIYRLVWNRTLRVLQVASEFTRSRTKGGRNAHGGRHRAAWLAAVPLSLPLLALAATPSTGITTTTAALTATAVAANALPTGGQVTNGSGRLAQHGDTLTVTQQSQILSLNWLTFNIGSQSTVDFVQPDASAVAVNRIADTNGSQIFGHLDANGQVFLINPNGVLFGQGAQVNVGGLVASTLNVDDSALGSGSLSFSGAGKGKITNLGTINVTGGGYVALLGNQVSNQGAIHAQLGSVALAGGSAVTLNFDGDKLVSVRVDQSVLDALAQNGQLIEADGGNVWMTAGARDSLLASAVNNTGTIDAQTVQNQNGHIVLTAGMDAGTVTVSGTLDASAPAGGNGGQIETSAANVNIANTAKITTAAQLGLSGTWLIDPNDFTIGPGKTGTVTGGVPSGDISGATLSSALSSGNVVIQSAEGSIAGSGNVNVDDTVSWNSHTLTLDAQNNININATMTASGTADLALNYGGTNGSSSATPAANTSVDVGLGGSGFAGQVNFTGSNALSINGNSYTLINSATALQGITTSGLGARYALAANLSLSGNFTPIGNGSAFSGVFDGLGHTISGLTITNTSATDVGLFGASSGTIRNVGLLLGSVSGSSVGADIGGLVGDNSGTISNVFTTGTVSGLGGGEWIGGLVGYNESSGTISNAYATGAVSGSSYTANIGGLVGANYGSIRNAYATGSVSGSYGGLTQDGMGGLVGYNTGTIANAYAKGSVSWGSAAGTYGNDIGGLVGYSYGGSITDAYATGHVSSLNSIDQLGGLVGVINNGGTVTASYWDTATTGQPSGTSNSSTTTTGMTGLTTAQMMQPGNFSWAIATSGGSSAPWRIYTGNTMPLIESLLIPLTISASNQTVTYNGTNQDATVLSSSSLASPNLSAITGLALTNAQHAGGYTETVSSSAYSTNYDLSFGTLSANLTIDPATLTPILINSGVTKIYNGTTAAPTGFTPTYSYSGLVSGDTGASLTDTSALYNSAHVASATGVTVSGLNISGITGSNGSLSSDYTLTSNSASVAATITPATLTPTLTDSGVTKIYNGTIAAPVGFTPTYSYTGLISGDTAASLTDTGVLYNSAHVASATDVTVSGLSISGITGSNGSLASDYSLASSSASVAASITPATLTPTLTNSGVTKTYDGTTDAPIGFTATYSYSGLVSGDTGASLTDTSAAYNSAHVASATNVTVSGLSISSITGSNGSQASDYSLASSSVNTAATITPATLTLTLTNSSVTKIYDGTTNAPAGFTPTYSYGGLVSGDTSAAVTDTSAAYNSADVVNASNVTVSGLSISGITGSNGSLTSDYSLASSSASVAASITPAALTASLTGSISKVYDGTTTATLTSGDYTLSGFVSGQGATVTQTSGLYNSSNVVGATTVTATLGSGNFNADSGTSLSNYTLPTSASGTASITPALLLVTANNANKTYDGAAYSGGNGVTYSGFVNGEGTSVLGGTLAYGGNSQGAINAGFYTITPSGLSSSNYTINYDNGALTVSPATLTASLIGTTSKVYDGTTAATLTSGNYTLTGVIGSDAVSLNDPTSGVYATANAGSGINVQASGLVISGSGASNYQLSNSTATAPIGTITPAPLTITANNASIIYNAQAYSGGNGATYHGFVDGQTAAVLGGTLTYGGSSQGALNVGNYTLTPGGLASGNYAITYDSGTLAISPATLTYVATPVQTYAGQSIPPLTGTVTGLQGSDTLTSATTGTLAFTTPATTQSMAGQYAVDGSGLAANDGDYVFVQAAGNAQALTVLLRGEAALPGVAFAQQQLGQPAPAATLLPLGGLLASTAALPSTATTQDEEITTPPRSSLSAGVSDLYTPDVRVIGGGVRLP